MSFFSPKPALKEDITTKLRFIKEYSFPNVCEEELVNNFPHWVNSST